MPAERVDEFTVIKTYRDDLRWQWGREVAFLRRLERAGDPYFPRIIELGDHSITMNWCGRSLTDRATFGVHPNAIRAQLAHAVTCLEREQIRHRDITEHNVLWHPDAGLHLVDFGWSCWEWEERTPIPLPDVMHGMRRPDRAQIDDLMKKLETLRHG